MNSLIHALIIYLDKVQCTLRVLRMRSGKVRVSQEKAERALPLGKEEDSAEKARPGRGASLLLRFPFLYW